MILGILQARASSRWLPGKVLNPILGRPMLARQIERLRRARRLDRLVVATSSDASDDAIAALCQSLAVDCFRGCLDDVFDRCYQAARCYAPRAVVRLTGDCPLADPAFTTADILALLERRPDIAAKIGHAPTNEGYQRPLAADAAVLAACKGKT